MASEAANLSKHFEQPKFVNRTDYSRGRKRSKSADPWNTNYWLQNLTDPLVSDPTSRNGKKFRGDFRIPHIVFIGMITLLKAIKDENGNPDKAFNYSDKVKGGQPSIPLEIKVMCVLRVLAEGLKFKDAAELSGFMSETEANRFFKELDRL